jgi:hypothetical protein
MGEVIVATSCRLVSFSVGKGDEAHKLAACGYDDSAVPGSDLVIRIILMLVWAVLACGLYVFINLPTVGAEQRQHVELLFWLAAAAAVYNALRWCLDAWNRRRHRQAEIKRHLEEPQGPIRHPEFRLEDADERITRRDVE